MTNWLVTHSSNYHSPRCLVFFRQFTFSGSKPLVSRKRKILASKIFWDKTQPGNRRHVNGFQGLTNGRLNLWTSGFLLLGTYGSTIRNLQWVSKAPGRVVEVAKSAFVSISSLLLFRHFPSEFVMSHQAEKFRHLLACAPKDILLRKSSSCDPVQANHSKSVNVTQFIDRNIQKGVGTPTTWSCPKKLRRQRIFFRATQTYSTLFGVTLKWTPWVVQLQTFSKSALARSITDHLNFQFPRHTGTWHLLSIAIHLGARSLENFTPRKRHQCR